MSKKTKLGRAAETPPAREGFFRATVTIPAELGAFTAEQKSRPEHAGNLSSYVRALILRDRESQKALAA